MSDINKENVRTLVVQAANGDREAFHELYNVYVLRIFNFVLGLVKDQEFAEDITQDSFVLAYRNLTRLKDPEKFETWLYKIARNEVYQSFRKKKADEIQLEVNDHKKFDIDKGIGKKPKNPEEAFLDKELSLVVERTLKSLPLKLREVFILSLLQRKSYKEIADIVGRSLLSVKTDIYRARVYAKDMIRRYLQQG